MSRSLNVIAIVTLAAGLGAWGGGKAEESSLASVSAALDSPRPLIACSGSEVDETPTPETQEAMQGALTAHVYGPSPAATSPFIAMGASSSPSGEASP
jgi:hypothetical protein